MKIRVRLFALAKDAAKDGSIQLDLPHGATVAQLREKLVENIPELKSITSLLRFAVDTEYATDETIVQPDNEIACIPPVSGG